MEPPQFLAAGDVVRCEVVGLGAIEHPIVAT
jgi:2-keto-4-pentenoate hydratase/2-oxohepta-3-ene-1,7-dioic acid hydratase in catechol pathway